MDWPAFYREQWENYHAIMVGLLAAPPCFTCRGRATHVGKNISGSYAYQCDRHANNDGFNEQHHIEYRPLPVFPA